MLSDKTFEQFMSELEEVQLTTDGHYRCLYEKHFCALFRHEGSEVLYVTIRPLNAAWDIGGGGAGQSVYLEFKK